MKGIIITLVLILIVLQHHLWFVKNAISGSIHLKESVDLQKKENQIISNQNQLLTEKILNLKKSEDIVETIAREKMGMIKQGETYYQFVEK